VPTLVVQGDDDQIVPSTMQGSCKRSLVKNAQLKVYQGAPHGLCTTEKEKVNADLLGLSRSNKGNNRMNTKQQNIKRAQREWT